MDTMSSITPTNAPFPWVESSNASIDKMIRSNQIWAAGCRKIGDIMAEIITGHFTQMGTVWQAMSQVKTVKDAVELQSTYLRTTTEHSVASAKRLVEATKELTQEVMSAKVDLVLIPTSAAVAIV